MTEAERKAKAAAYARAYRAKNRDKVNAYQRAWNEANKDKVKKKSSQYRKTHKAKNPNVDRDKHYKKRYGLTVEEYDKISASQNYVCAICSLPESKVKKNGIKLILVVDHDHSTGKVRQLLCNKCNIFIGHIETSNAPLSAYIEYLEKHT